MIPHDDGYRPVFIEGEEPYIDWFRGGACGLEVFPRWGIPKGAGIVEKSWDRDSYIIAPKPLHLLLRWLPWWRTPHYDRYPWFWSALRAPKWEIWYAKPGCFGFRGGMWSIVRYSREAWNWAEKGSLGPEDYPRFGLTWTRW